MTKLQAIDELNKNDNPREIGGSLLGADGHGHECWQLGRGAAKFRLARNDLEFGGYEWTDDISGWE